MQSSYRSLRPLRDYPQLDSTGGTVAQGDP